MVTVSYYDKLSIQLELETYIESLDKAKKLVQELDIKRAFYKYYSMRNNDEKTFVIDYLTSVNSDTSNSLYKVVKGYTEDSTNNVTIPIDSNVPFNLGRLNNIQGIVVSSNGPIPPEIKHVVDLIKHTIEQGMEQSNDDSGWKPL